MAFRRRARRGRMRFRRRRRSFGRRRGIRAGIRM